MDHGASQRAARLLVLQTEDHAAADNDGLQGEATKPRESGDSGQVCPRARPGINETCAGLSRNQVAAAEWGSWWRWPRSHLAPEAGGRPAHRPPGYGGTSRAAPPCAQPSARCLLAHARAPARANYRVPELRTVHPRTGQARAPRASPSAGSGVSLMFPRPGRPVGAAQPLPRRARATGLAVGAQPGAQRSPCVRPGCPDGTSGLGAPGGDAHSSYFRSPMSRPARPPTPEGIGRRRGWPPCAGRS